MASRMPSFCKQGRVFPVHIQTTPARVANILFELVGSLEERCACVLKRLHPRGASNWGLSMGSLQLVYALRAGGLS